MNKPLPLVVAALTLGLPAVALAHPGHGGLGHGGPSEFGGLASGLLHPLSGPDHLLSLVAVALLAVRLGGHAMWALPAGFMASGVVGGALAWSDMTVPLAESMMLGPVVVGMVVVGMAGVARVLPARDWNVPTGLLAAVPLFGLFHGFAHLSEMGVDDSPARYVVGVLVASAGVMALTALGAKILRTGQFASPGGLPGDVRRIA